MVLPAAEPVRWLRSPALAGAVILGLGIPMLWSAWLVSALFDRSSVLGWAGLVGMLAGLSLIGVSMGRELRGLAALRRVDQLRADLAQWRGRARGESGTALGGRLASARGDVAGFGRGG